MLAGYAGHYIYTDTGDFSSVGRYGKMGFDYAVQTPLFEPPPMLTWIRGSPYRNFCHVSWSEVGGEASSEHGVCRCFMSQSQNEQWRMSSAFRSTS